MSKTFSIFLVFWIPVCLSSRVSAQDVKREREEYIAKNKLPAEVLRFIELLPKKDIRKMKYYRETDGEEVGYEIKFFLNKKKYSIEFDGSGSLQDAEVRISLNEIPQVVKERIEAGFKDRFDRYKIRELQRQYTCTDSEEAKCSEKILRMIASAEVSGLAIRYEIEIDGTKAGKSISRELLFDSEGNVRQERTILRRQTDNILY